ncbi:MAG: VacJ family lipoprotein [Rhodospirillaceae bacterium]
MNKGIRGNFRRGAVVAGLLTALLGGCATPPTEPAALAEFEQTNDPLEPMNRYFFEVNRFLDFMFIRPWADTYRRIVPDFARERVHNVLRNMGEPLDFANEMLQGRAEDGGISVGRLVVNSTVGLGGIFDVATDIGLPSKEGDFGQTLYSWGASDGPYLVLPVLGPSNLRDAVGKGVDTAADPVGWAFSIGDLSMASYGRAGGEALDKRSEFVDQLDSLEKTSIDFYAQLRSMMRQHRTKELRGESASAADAYPNMDMYSDTKTPVGK